MVTIAKLMTESYSMGAIESEGSGHFYRRFVPGIPPCLSFNIYEIRGQIESEIQTIKSAYAVHMKSQTGRNVTKQNKCNQVTLLQPSHQNATTDMIFVKKFTLTDFQAKNFTQQKCVVCNIVYARYKSVNAFDISNFGIFVRIELNVTIF